MAKQKYSDNIVTRPRQEELDENEEFGEVRKSNIYVDGDIVKGGWYLQGSWLYKASEKPYPEKTHSHEHDEYLVFIGTNPDDPYDLGGEVDLYLDGEKYTITETSTVFIPGGVDHCPIYCKRVDSPIYLLATFPNKTYQKTYLEDK